MATVEYLGGIFGDPFALSSNAAMSGLDKPKPDPKVEIYDSKAPYLTVNGEEYERDKEYSPTLGIGGYYLRFKKKVKPSSLVTPGVMLTLDDYTTSVRVLEQNTNGYKEWRCWNYETNEIVHLYVSDQNITKIKKDGTTIFSR